MFQNFDLVSGLSIIILDFSDKKIVSFKVYTVTRKFYEYSEYWSTLNCKVSLLTKSAESTDDQISTSN